MTLVLPTFDDSDQARKQAQEALLRTELDDLAKALPEYKKYRDYFDGEQELVYTTKLFRDVFGTAFTGFRDNWMRSIVEPVLDKMQLMGVGVNQGDSTTARTTASLVWDCFRENEIDEEQFNLHEGMLVEKHAYAILWPDEDMGCSIDWQPAGLVRVRYDSDRRRKARWAVKRWQAEDGAIYVSVYTDRYLYKFIEQEGSPATLESSTQNALDEIPKTGSIAGFDRRVVEGEPWPLEHSFGAVPVVEFNNTSWRSELKDHIPQQDALNKILLDMLIASEFAAVPQKLIETQAKQPVGGWKAGAGEVWHLPVALDPDGRAIKGQWGEFSAHDPRNFIAVTEMWRQHMALTSRTPLRYFASVDRGGRGDAPSGDSLLVDDQPHNNKVSRKQLGTGNRWLQVAKLAATQIENASVEDLRLGEMIWRDPRFEFRAAILEEARTMIDVGLPFRWVIQKLGLTTKEIEEIEKLKDKELDEARKREDEMLDRAQENQRQQSNQSNQSNNSNTQNSDQNNAQN